MRSFNESVDVHRYAYIHHFRAKNTGKLDADRMFGELDMRTLPEGNPNAPVVLFASNRGRTVKLFDNPHYRAQLLEWGLTPETALSCAFKFLFKPAPGTVRAVVQELAALDAAGPEVLRIGLQIRRVQLA